MRNCHPLEIVGRDSDTQLQVGKHLNNITQHKDGSCEMFYVHMFDKK